MVLVHYQQNMIFQTKNCELVENERAVNLVLKNFILRILFWWTWCGRIAKINEKVWLAECWIFFHSWKIHMFS